MLSSVKFPKGGNDIDEDNDFIPLVKIQWHKLQPIKKCDLKYELLKEYNANTDNECSKEDKRCCLILQNRFSTDTLKNPYDYKTCDKITVDYDKIEKMKSNEICESDDDLWRTICANPNILNYIEYNNFILPNWPDVPPQFKSKRMDTKLFYFLKTYYYNNAMPVQNNAYNYGNMPMRGNAQYPQQINPMPNRYNNYMSIYTFIFIFIIHR